MENRTFSKMGLTNKLEVTGSKMVAEPEESGSTSPSLSFPICAMGENGHCDTAPQGRPGEAVTVFKG